MKVYDRIITLIKDWVYVFSMKDLKWCFPDVNYSTLFRAKEKLLEQKIIIPLTKTHYIAKMNNFCYDFRNISACIDHESYVSLYSSLEGMVTKQTNRIVFCATPNKIKNVENNVNDGWIKWIIFIQIKVPQTFWIITDAANNRIADRERGLLDLIYSHCFGKYKIVNELYMENIDRKKIESYLKHYPEKVKHFYFNCLEKHAKW